MMVLNGIYRNKDNVKVSFLILLDVIAPFDKILLDRL